VVLKPTIVGDLTWVKASHVSPQGEIVSEWRHSEQETTFTMSVPGDTTATVLLPTAALNSVVRTAPPTSSSVKFVKVEDGFTVFEITAAGTYAFTMEPLSP